MANFLPIGNHFLNLEQVAQIELVPDLHGRPPGKLAAVRVYFTSGLKQDFKGSEEIRALSDYVREHPAP